MKSASYRAGVESLETRQVLSATLLGHGTGTLLARTPIQTGSYEIELGLQGTAHRVGAFTGVVVVDLGINQLNVTAGTVTLTDSAGDTVQANLIGAYHISKPGTYHEQATLRYTIVSGTGAFQGATGQGRLDIGQNIENNHIRFTITNP